MDPERKNLLSIIRTRGKKKEWKLKNDLLEQWFHKYFIHVLIATTKYCRIQNTEKSRYFSKY